MEVALFLIFMIVVYVCWMKFSENLHNAIGGDDENEDDE